MNIKTFALGTVALCTLLAAGPRLGAQSPPPNLDYVMRAVFQGPQIKGVKIHGHTFNIKRASISANGGTVSVKLRISHTWRMARDDQVDISFTKVNGRLQGVPKVNIKYRGWKENVTWAVKIAKVVFKYYQHKQGSQRQALIQMQDASNSAWNLPRKPKWEDVVNALVNEIVLRTDSRGRDHTLALRAATKGNGVTAFRRDSFRGPGLDLFRSSPNLHRQGLGDAISSIQIPAGCTVILYEHKGYKGRSIRLTRSVKNFKKLRKGKKHWGDCVSSIKIERR